MDGVSYFRSDYQEALSRKLNSRPYTKLIKGYWIASIDNGMKIFSLLESLLVEPVYKILFNSQEI